MKTKEYAVGVRTILGNLPFKAIVEVIEVLEKVRAEGRRIFIMGNGGSGSTASHIAGDLMKGCHMDAMCLNDNMATLTAWANDESYDDIFAEQLDDFVQADDVVIVLSASGNSRNILRAIRMAGSIPALTVALTGFDGGQVKDLADISVIVPSENMQQIEDAHLMIGHMITTALREE